MQISFIFLVLGDTVTQRRGDKLLSSFYSNKRIRLRRILPTHCLSLHRGRKSLQIIFRLLLASSNLIKVGEKYAYNIHERQL